MTSKMISIRDDVYQNLKNLKDPNESFSELIERLIKNQQKNPLKYFGIAKDLSEEVMVEFEKAVMEGKKDDALRSSSKFTELWEGKL
ncbi:MAG: antitoxin [Candidatus Lokiarchaeota archaeon]|nr:antitoxin [Candidatus Lokiarchaeota archaeon]